MDLESIQKLYKTNIYYNSDVNGNTTTEIFQNGTKKNNIYTTQDPRVNSMYMVLALIGIIIVVRNIK